MSKPDFHTDFFFPGDKPREECGVFGIYDLDGNPSAEIILSGLLALQHRGQESCGIAVSDTKGPWRNISFHKGLGLVSEVFKPETVAKLCGNLGVGHVRYATSGSASAENAQPLVLNYVKGTIALAHNGNLVNAAALRREMEYSGAIFHTTVDSEVIAFQIARERLSAPTAEEAVNRAAKRLKGSYALVIASPRKLMGIRDPFGLKPLCLGRKGNAWILASESCALSAVGAQFVRDVLPGEIVTITKDGVFSSFLSSLEKKAHCAFEYIYFARLDSVLDRVPVYEARLRAGACLAKSCPAEADLVAGVPESGIPAALGYANALGIPFGSVFYKNSYIGRTFLKPSQSQREAGVRLKLSVLASAAAGKRIVLVDDSLVRGTTMANLISMLKEAGAAAVHVRISSPPFLFPCYFGTDVPTGRQLIASSRSQDEICRMIGADSLGYLPLESLSEMAEGLPLCQACFDGRYPMEVPGKDIRNILE